MTSFYNIDCINSAIVVTENDLNGFWHPLGFRTSKNISPKNLSYVIGNLVCFSAQKDTSWNIEKEEGVKYLDGFISPFEYKKFKSMSYSDVVKEYKPLLESCDEFRKDRIRNILILFLNHYHIIMKKIDSGVISSSYLPEKIDKKTNLGKLVLAMMELFGVDEKLAQAKNSTWVKKTDATKRLLCSMCSGGDRFTKDADIRGLLCLMIDLSHNGLVQVETIVRSCNHGNNFHLAIEQLFEFLKGDGGKLMKEVFIANEFNMFFRVYKLDSPIEKYRNPNKYESSAIYQICLVKEDADQGEKEEFYSFNLSDDLIKNVDVKLYI